MKSIAWRNVVVSIMILGGVSLAAWHLARSDRGTHLPASTEALSPPVRVKKSTGVVAIASYPGASPTLRRFLKSADRLPADFHSDVLLRLLEISETGGTAIEGISALKDDLAMQAYKLAFDAERRFPGIRIGADSGIDVEQSLTTSGLDQLSLQTRALLLISPTLRERTPSLVADLPSQVARVDCGAEFVDDPSPLFQTALWLAAANGTPSDRIDRLINETDSAMGLQRAIKLVIALPPGSYTDHARLTQDISRAFQRVRDADSNFTTAELGIASDLPLLIQRLGSTPGVTTEINSAYKTFISRHLLSSHRCPGSLRGNHYLLEQRFVIGDTGLTPASSSADDRAEPDPLRGIIERVRTAAFTIRSAMLDAVGGQAMSAAQLATATDAFLETVNDATVIEAAAADDTGRIHRARVEALRDYLEYAPPGLARQHTCLLLFQLMNANFYQRHHDAWFADIKTLAISMTSWPDRDTQLQQLIAGESPVLATYSDLLLHRLYMPPGISG